MLLLRESEDTVLYTVTVAATIWKDEHPILWLLAHILLPSPVYGGMAARRSFVGEEMSPAHSFTSLWAVAR